MSCNVTCHRLMAGSFTFLIEKYIKNRPASFSNALEENNHFNLMSAGLRASIDSNAITLAPPNVDIK